MAGVKEDKNKLPILALTRQKACLCCRLLASNTRAAIYLSSHTYQREKLKNRCT